MKFEGISSTSGHAQIIIAQLEYRQGMTGKVLKRPEMYQAFHQCFSDDLLRGASLGRCANCKNPNQTSRIGS